jgi:hypothetical protein
MAHRISPRAEADLADLWFYAAKESGSIEIAKALSQLLWPDKDRAVWFSLEKNHEEPIASVYTNCETALAASSTQSQTVSYFSPASFISDAPEMKISVLDAAA